MANIALRPEFWASVSGGKDSLYMLRLILQHPEQYPLHGVVHYELEIDYPFIKNVIDYMESECKRVGIRFWRIKPRRTWKELLTEYGFPSRKNRWCNGEYKLDCYRQLREWLKKQNVKPVIYIGLCADEKKRFKAELFDRDANFIYPLAEQGIEEWQILEWAKSVPAFEGYYQYNDRCGCMWCPLMSIKESAYLAVFYPEQYETVMNAAREREKVLSEKYGHQRSVWQGNGKYNTDYRDRMVHEKYIPALFNKQMTLFDYKDEE